MRLHGTQRKRCHHSSAVHLSPRPPQAGFPGDQERGDSCSVPIRHQATGTCSRRWAGTGAKQNRGTTPKCSKTRDVEASPLCRDPLGPDPSLLLLSQCREPFTPPHTHTHKLSPSLEQLSAQVNPDLENGGYRGSLGQHLREFGVSRLSAGHTGSETRV